MDNTAAATTTAANLQLDPIKMQFMLRQIKAQLDFDPTKTPLARTVIMDIYRKYFNEDYFAKLRDIDTKANTYRSIDTPSTTPPIPTK